MLPQEKPAKKKVKLLRLSSFIDIDSLADKEPGIGPVSAGLDNDTDLDESGPGEQESSDEEEDEQEEGLDQEAAVADKEEPSPVVSRKRKRAKASGEHLWISTFDCQYVLCRTSIYSSKIIYPFCINLFSLRTEKTSIQTCSTYRHLPFLRQ